jgi:hypothetical protein
MRAFAGLLVLAGEDDPDAVGVVFEPVVVAVGVAVPVRVTSPVAWEEDMAADNFSSPAVMVTGIYEKTKLSVAGEEYVTVGVPSLLPPTLIVVHTCGTVPLMEQCREKVKLSPGIMKLTS